MLESKQIAVVVPAHNEERLIGRVIETMPEYVDLVIVVDDASLDRTTTAALEPGDPRVQVAQHGRNQGVGAAIATGYRRARQLGADVVAVMAGDNQMHPDDLLTVLMPVVQERADYVKGDRVHHPEASRCMPLGRRLGSTVLAYCTRKALGMKQLSDSQCGFTAISAKAIDTIDLKSLWPRFGYPNDLLGLLRLHNLRVMDVIVRPVYATEVSELRVRHVGLILGLIARAGWRVRVRPYLPKVRSKIASTCRSTY